MRILLPSADGRRRVPRTRAALVALPVLGVLLCAMGLCSLWFGLLLLGVLTEAYIPGWWVSDFGIGTHRMSDEVSCLSMVAVGIVAAATGTWLLARCIRGGEPPPR